MSNEQTPETRTSLWDSIVKRSQEVASVGAALAIVFTGLAWLASKLIVTPGLGKSLFDLLFLVAGICGAIWHLRKENPHAAQWMLFLFSIGSYLQISKSETPVSIAASSLTIFTLVLGLCCFLLAVGFNAYLYEESQTRIRKLENESESLAVALLAVANKISPDTNLDNGSNTNGDTQECVPEASPEN